MFKSDGMSVDLIGDSVPAAILANWLAAAIEPLKSTLVP
jgi:hypothetical protein